jgi:hypothetical protein
LISGAAFLRATKSASLISGVSSFVTRIESANTVSRVVFIPVSALILKKFDGVKIPKKYQHTLKVLSPAQFSKITWVDRKEKTQTLSTAQVKRFHLFDEWCCFLKCY